MRRLIRSFALGALVSLLSFTSGGLVEPLAAQTCTVTLSHNNATFDISGGPGTIRVVAGCNWIASADVPWITFRTASTGTLGTTNVGYDVAPSTTLSRIGNITFANAAAPATTLATFSVGQLDAVLTVMIESPARQARVVQPFDVHGWALDKNAPSGTGVTSVELRVRDLFAASTVAFPTTYGLARDHTAARFGAHFRDAGFTARIDGLPAAPTGTQYALGPWYTTPGGGPFLPGEIAVTVVPPALELNVTVLRFGVVNTGGGAGPATSAQDIRISGIGLRPWTATTDRPWLQLSRASGVGAASLSVAIDTSQATLPPSGLLTGSVHIDVPGVPGTPRDVQIQLQVYQRNTTQPPFGVIETPADGAPGLRGAIPVTGWALDDVQVGSVALYRAPVAGEPGGSLVFLANAGLIEGARPDVRDAFPSYPLRDRAGWGVMVLTNMLPNQGNGTYTLHAFANDVEGRTSYLGSRTFSSNNTATMEPFGTIDTPAQGETISGVYTVFGWALAPQPNTILPERILMFVDGFYVGWVRYGSFRPDVAALFPGLNDTNRAGGHFILDTRLLSNGLHTMSWMIQPAAGSFQHVGSRFFVVNNP